MDGGVKVAGRMLLQVKDDDRMGGDGLSQLSGGTLSVSGFRSSEERIRDDYYKKVLGDVQERIDGRRNVVLSRLLISDRRINAKTFCRCAGCDAIPAVPKNYAYCCKEVFSVNALKKSFAVTLAGKIGKLKCITRHPAFEAICLSTEMLDLLSTHGGVFPSFAPGECGGRKNQDYRYMAYRSFNKWIHNEHTLGNRLEIPLCALKKIMEKFPVLLAEYVPNFPGLITIFGASFFYDYRDEEETWMANNLGNEDSSEWQEEQEEENRVESDDEDDVQ